MKTKSFAEGQVGWTQSQVTEETGGESPGQPKGQGGAVKLERCQKPSGA